MSVFTSLGLGTSGQNLKNAHKLFSAGKFVEARIAYSVVLAKNSTHLQSMIYMGHTSLLLDQLDDAERWLIQASAIAPKKLLVNQLLAELYYRRKDFQKAALYFRAIERIPMARKLENFNAQTPYETDSDFDKAVIPFRATEPLPIVRVVINGLHEGNFIIDTGGGELTLDTTFAEECSAELFGSEKANGFGGGKAGIFGHGKISKISLGSLDARNVPINTLSLRHIELAGIKIDGIIGTIFLYQFLSTIDYKKGCLVLRNKKKYSFASILQQTNGASIVPFAMAGDHYMVSHGSLNDCDNMLWFVDTGLAGVAFGCPTSTIKKGKLNVQKSNKSRGEGGGGSFDIYPFEVETICLDTLCVRNVHGEFGVFPSQLEYGLGFKIDGMVSHEYFKGFSLTIDFKEMKYILGK